MRGEQRLEPQAKSGIALASLFEETRTGASAELSGGLKQFSLTLRVRLHGQCFAILLPEQAQFAGKKYGKISVCIRMTRIDTKYPCPSTVFPRYALVGLSQCGSADFHSQPGTGVGPPFLGRRHRDVEHSRSLLERHAHEIAQLH